MVAGAAYPAVAADPVMQVVPAVSFAATGSGAELRASLEPLLGAVALSKSSFGVQVVRVSDGVEVLGVGSDVPMLPASTTKLLTAAAALDALGPSFTFNTDIHADGAIVGGVLKGNLYIEGHADPTLTPERLWRIARDLRLEGIDRIDGDVVFDDTYFSEGARIPAWDAEEDFDRGVTYCPPIGALASDFGAVTVVVRPGAEAGKPVVVELGSPAPGYIRVENKATTAREGSRSRVSIERRVAEDHITFEIEGTLAIDASPRRDRRTVVDPTAYTMAMFSAILEEVDIQVSGTTHEGEVPQTGARRIHRLYSPPLASVLMDTNKYSSNFMAEMVLRTMGAEIHGRGTTEAGLDVLRAYLTRIGVPATDYVIRNGSGLSRETRIAPSVLTAVLIDMAHDAKVGSEFIASLSIAGKDGTLGSRLTDVAGLIRGKTGTLGGVHCLAGYAMGSDGEIYAYAFLVNDLRGSLDAVKALQDDFLREIVAADEADA
jgi:D-alanyl-D-alanine carboxypeptidase/D-alanyl-D-alanine-endopeptidase (penicillin-binding protein 4)